MVVYRSFHSINPNLKREIPEEGGKPIADPFTVVRGIIWTDNNEETFTVYTPPMSGRLERIVVMPDHNDVPGTAGAFSLTANQFYIEAPVILGALPAPYVDTLDVLNALGAGLVNDAVTHLHTLDITGTRNPIIPQLLVQDILQLNFTGWSDQSIDVRRVYIYFYFSNAGAGGAGGGSDGALDVETLQLYGTTTLNLAGVDADDSANITFSGTTGRGKLMRVRVIRTANAGTAYTVDTHEFETFDINIAGAPVTDGVHTIYLSTELEPDAVGGRLLNDTDVNFGNIQFENTTAGQVGVLSVTVRAAGGAGDSTETVLVELWGERVDA